MADVCGADEIDRAVWSYVSGHTDMRTMDSPDICSAKLISRLCNGSCASLQPEMDDGTMFQGLLPGEVYGEKSSHLLCLLRLVDS